MRTITIVVPCFNEAERLPTSDFERYLGIDPSTRFVFVDDGSTDSTLEVLESLATKGGERCEVLGLDPNRGKAEAVRQGLLRALSTDVEVVGFWDADLATPLETILPMAEEFDSGSEVEAVFGSRIRMLGRYVERGPLRHYAGRVFATAVSLLLEAPIYDSQCGAKLFRSSPLIRKVFAEEFVSRWIFDVEILARIRRQVGAEGWSDPGAIIREFPLDTWRDISGSKLKSSDFARSFTDLVKINRRYPR